MRTCLSMLGVAGLGGVVLALGPAPGSGLAPSAEPAAPVTERLTLSSPFEGGDSHYIDLGKKGLGAGDVFTSVGVPVHDETTHRRVGSMDGMETILSRWHAGTVSQTFTFRFKGGTVSVAGTLRHTEKPLRMPVVGGTGEYADVTGQMILGREDRERKVSITRLVLRHVA